MPKLLGGPAYSRPGPRLAQPVERPFDPDDLPLEADRSAEDHDLVQQVIAQAYDSAGADASTSDGSPGLRGRPFRLRLPGISKPEDGRGQR
ncbi:MAG: hypothetical protein WCK58_11525 [Chloroflexota bacterium]